MAAFRALDAPVGDVDLPLPFNGKNQVTLFSANDLFSHPETHQPQAESGPAGSDQPSWTNLFQEPVPAPRVPSEH